MFSCFAAKGATFFVRGFGCALFILEDAKMSYPGFDKLEDDSPLFRSLPLCDMLHSFLGDRDFSYISAAYYPLELTELIFHYLEYQKGVRREVIDNFSNEHLTEDSLCPIDKLLTLYGEEKFSKMITELQALCNK